MRQFVLLACVALLLSACNGGTSPNQAPTAEAGEDRAVGVGDTVTLDALGSSDPDGDDLSYAWSLDSAPDGSSAVLSETEGVTTQLTPDAEGGYVVSVTVSDGEASDVDDVTVTAGEPPAAPSFTEDGTLEPAVAQVDGIEGTGPRPVARVTDDEGHAADFVANELVVMTADDAALQEFVNRWKGRVLRTIDFSAEDSSFDPAHLVRIDPSGVDPGQLAEDLRELDPNSQGQHRVSSQAGLDTLAVAADEAAAGLTVTANWLARQDDIVSGDTGEDPDISDGSLTDPSDAFTWPYMNRGSPQDVGVGAAWQALKAAGVLDDVEPIRIAILDRGFAEDAMDDLPADRETIGAFDVQNPVDCSGGSSCPWHGTKVAQAAMATPDDGNGVAGPAGPVAEALLVDPTSPDAFETAEFVAEVAREYFVDRPGILNYSAGARIPASLAAVANPLWDTTGLWLRNSGIIPFSSAGNSGDHVDEEDCFLACWEKATYAPCENDGFICVGGLDWNSTGKHGDSNFGTDGADRGDTVNIFGPYVMLLGPVPPPANDAGSVSRASGTSFASPFVAGVAALVWAADPTLSNREVEDILYDTAHTGSSSANVPRWVNAYGAVTEALGGVPEPYVELLSPADGESFQEAEPISFEARAIALEGSADFDWEIDGEALDHTLDEVPSFERRDLCPGDHTVQLVVSDDSRSSDPVQRTVTVVNRAPEVSIEDAPDTIGENNDFRLRGTAVDPTCDDLAGGRVDLDRLIWDLEDGFGGTGAGIVAQFDDQGSKSVTLSYTDEHGEAAQDTTTVNVGAFDPDADPVVSIHDPNEGRRFELTGSTPICHDIDVQAQASSSVDDADLVWTYDHGDGPVEFGTGRNATLELRCNDVVFAGGLVPFDLTVRVEGESAESASDTVTVDLRTLGL